MWQAGAGGSGKSPSHQVTPFWVPCLVAHGSSLNSCNVTIKSDITRFVPKQQLEKSVFEVV